MFRELFPLSSEATILDLGSDDGGNINSVLRETPVRPENVYIADIDPAAVATGSAVFGYRPVVIDEAGRLPFPDAYFDIVFCSSVIEHVTVPKDYVWTLRSGRAFRREARRRQKAFADEIRRVGKCYFVQTPYRHFLVESHTWLPFVGWLPRSLMIPLMRFTNSFWVKKSIPDFHLLDRREMSQLFGGARILEERAFGMIKSIIAVSI